MNVTLNVNVNNNTLVSGLSNNEIQPSTLPLYFGDTISLNIYLLQFPANWDPQNPSSTLSYVPLDGMQLFLYLDDGLIDGDIYTQQIAFTQNAAKTYFIGTLTLNTPALSELLGTSPSAECWLKIGYVQAGQQTTVLSKKVTVNVGLPSAAVGAPAVGQTALSVEVANGTYMPLVMQPGQAITLVSADGKKIALFASDNPDGTAELKASQIN